MLAVDTNVVVRVITDDDPRQSARAKAVIAGEEVYVCLTVLLETEWVLRRVYGYAAEPIATTLRAFCGIPNVTLEDAGIVAQALDWMEAGMDFADALHLAQSHGCEAFVTFDRQMVRVARTIGAPSVRAP